MNLSGYSIGFQALPPAGLPRKRPGDGLFQQKGLVRNRIVFAGSDDQDFKSPNPLPQLMGCEVEEAKRHWPKLQKVQHLAQKAVQLLPNYSGRHYGALALLNDGTEGMSVNVEANRHTTLCDLRLAISQAQNNWLMAQPMKSPIQPTVPHVQTLYLVNGDPAGDQPIPCADCLTWLNSPLCQPETQLVSLEKPNQNADWQIRQRTAAKMLPFHKTAVPRICTTTQPLENLPVIYSKATCSSSEIQEKMLSPEKIRALVARAKQAYQTSKTQAGDSKHATGASLLLSPSGVIATGERLDWSNRWYESADTTASASAFSAALQYRRLAQCITEQSWVPEILKKRLRPYLPTQAIQAVAYYGDDQALPTIASLGRIARKKGSAQTLIITVEADQIQVRTIRDYLPELYRTGK